MHCHLFASCFPRELLDAPVWCVASPDAEGKLKIPMNPYTRKRASVDDASTWGSFDDACATAIELGYFLPGTWTPAVGHVLRVEDGIFVIDLDKPATSRQVWHVQQQIMEHFDSYIEESQSGLGFHIYARGFLLKGKRFKSAQVEMYGHARFIVATGRAVEDVPLFDHTLTLAQFIYDHAPEESNFIYNDSAPENQNAVARLAENSFVRDAFLTAGGWRSWFVDQSTADSVFMKEILRVTQNHRQAIEIFSRSPMGQRDKWQKRLDYRAATLENAALEVERDQREETRLAMAFIASMPDTRPEIPEVPFEFPKPDEAGYNEIVEVPAQTIVTDDYLPQAFAIRIPASRIYMGITEQLPAAQELLKFKSYPSRFRQPEGSPDVWESFKVGRKNKDFIHKPLPGFLGAFAKELSKSMLRPSLRLAESIALQLAQVVVGRGVIVMNNGLNMYHLIVGSSGVGKSTAKDMTSSFLMTIQERYDLVPFAIGDKPKSKEGLHSALNRAHNNEFFCTLDESQKFLSDIAGSRPNPITDGLAALLTDAYHKSDLNGMMNGSEASKSENSTTNIKRPYVVMSMSGLHKETLGALNGPLLKNGFVSRLYVTHVRDSDIQAKMNRTLAGRKDYPQEMYDRFAYIAKFFDRYSGDGDQPFQVALPDFIQEKHARFSDWVHGVVVRSDRAHYNRASLHALKLAAILAIFDNPKSCTITEELYDYAVGASLSSLNYFEDAEEEGLIGDTYSTRQQTVMNKLLLFYQSNPTEAARVSTCKRIGITPLIGQLGLVPYSWLLSQLSKSPCFRDDRAPVARVIMDTLRSMDGAGELTFYHQDHKGPFVYKDQTGAQVVVKAAAVDAVTIIKRELERRAGLHSEEVEENEA